MASPTHISRLMARILARMWVESVRCCCRSLSQPRSLNKASMASRSTCSPPPLHQACAKVRENGKIKAWVSQLQTESVLQINSSSHSLRRLSVRQFLHELHDGNECQSPWRLDRATILGKEMDKRLVLINSPQGIAHFHGEVTFRISSTSHTGRFFWDGKLMLRM